MDVLEWDEVFNFFCVIVEFVVLEEDEYVEEVE